MGFVKQVEMGRVTRGLLISLIFMGSALAPRASSAAGSEAGWLKSAGPPVTDVTARFRQIYETAKSGGTLLPSKAKEHAYLLVGGVFSRHYPGYMNKNLERLRGLGLVAGKVPIDTEATSEANAKPIRDAIWEAARGHRKTVLICHSKGGVDVAAALALYPEIKEHVRCVIAMQTAYGGSPIAGDVAASPGLRRVFNGLMADLLAHDPRVLDELSCAARKAFVAAHPYPVDVPTLSLATSRPAGMSILSAGIAYLSYRYGLKSDGLVVDMDAEIPGSRVVRLADMDHAESVLAGLPGFSNYDPGCLTEALVTLALE